MVPPVATETQDNGGAANKVMVKGMESWQDDRVRNNELKEMEIAEHLGGQDMYIDAEKVCLPSLPLESPTNSHKRTRTGTTGQAQSISSHCALRTEAART
jgi:hypothetical protein